MVVRPGPPVLRAAVRRVDRISSCHAGLSR
jgi:hypothetical protein